MPQLSACQPPPTRSPIPGLRTSEPTPTTVPTISCPGINGYLLKPQSLSIRCTSLAQTPQCEILISTSCRPSGPGSYLYGSKCAPAACTARPLISLIRNLSFLCVTRLSASTL